MESDADSGGSEIVSCAVFRRISYAQLKLVVAEIRARIQGLEPTAEEEEAAQVCKAAKTDQYRRAGFSSQAEFESWYASAKPPVAGNGRRR